MTAQHSKSASPAASGAKTQSSPDRQSHKNGGQDWSFLGISTLPESLQTQSAAWLTGQADFVAGMQDMMAERMKRCQDAAAESSLSFQRLCGSRNGAEAFSAYQEWLAGGMRFFMADLAAMQEQAARMTEMNQSALHALSQTESSATS